MYSENGRVKNNRATAGEETKPAYNLVSTIVCHNCSLKEEGVSKIFGEVQKCSRCGSTEVGFIVR